ncbi:Glutamate racemase 1 [Phycisphaerae bacterium RAS1]|nr:Glutamate racemase 1 [Phycisphaerae bacterium RAS1]
MSTQPIGVFDSGLGGLSVVRQLRRELPNENIVYFGDTARVPYGSKSKRTVVTFAVECARFVLQHDPKLIVAACNTASALAMEELHAALPVPVVGVVEPGAAAAARLADGGSVAVLGTEATIASRAYPTAIHALNPQAAVDAAACPLLVPLVEEGRDSADPIVQLAVRTYLEPLRGPKLRAVVLGCTHYPLLREAIAEFLGAGVAIVDSGRETALVVHERLAADGLLSPSREQGSIRCYVSDNPARFRRVSSRFLDEDVNEVELVEPERYISALQP